MSWWHLARHRRVFVSSMRKVNEIETCIGEFCTQINAENDRSFCLQGQILSTLQVDLSLPIYDLKSNLRRNLRLYRQADIKCLCFCIMDKQCVI
jgi:hypothetical protein